jgi:hypothetical protein
MITTFKVGDKANYTPINYSTVRRPSVPSGGGGGSKQEKKDTSEIPRYHEIKEVINDLSREYDKLSQAKDRAFGADRLSLMDKELELIEKQIEAQEE